MRGGFWMVPVGMCVVTSLWWGAGCSGGGGGGGAGAEPGADLSGFWVYTEMCDASDCGAGTVTDTFGIEISQSGNDLLVRTPFGVFAGTISGNMVTWSGNRLERNGTRSFSVNVVVAEPGNTFAGLEDWSFLGNDGTPPTLCTGPCDVTAIRQSDPPPEVEISGLWTAQNDCDETACGGGMTSVTFSAIFTQFGSRLEVETPFGSFEGDIDGDVATWSGSYPKDGGTLTFTVTVTIAANPSSYQGTRSFEWTDGTNSCVGTCTVSAIRETGPSGTTVDVRGIWFDERVCDESACGGSSTVPDTFVAAVDQIGSTFLFQTPDGAFFGRLSGNIGYWSGSRPKGNGTETFTSFVILDAGLTGYNGVKDFYFDDGASSCTGVCELTGDLLCPDVDLGNAFPITFTGTTLGAVDDFTPSCEPLSVASDVALQWTAPFSRTFRIDTAGSFFDTVLYLFDGVCSGDEIICNDDAPGGIVSRVDVFLLAGQTVTIVVDGKESAAGNYRINIE